MRNSPLRHVLALLRLRLGLKQKEMAALVGCSGDAIKSVELDRLTLSESLAKRITIATGISMPWLLENNLDAPMMSRFGSPYNRQVFEQAQAETILDLPADVYHDIIGVKLLRHYAELRAILGQAREQGLGSYELACYKVKKALEELTNEFVGGPPREPEGETYLADILQVATSDLAAVKRLVSREAKQFAVARRARKKPTGDRTK